MIPLRIERSPWFSPAAWLIAIANIGVFVTLVRLHGPAAEKIFSAWSFSALRFFEHPWSAHQLATLLTSAFLHASWVHLLGNVLYLAVFGPLVESRLGWRGFIALYVSCAALGALSYGALAPDPAPLVGASGAIAGVLGASLVLAPKARVTALVPVFAVFFLAALPQVLLVAVWFALQAASALGVVVSGPGTSHVAWLAHVGGFIGGAAIAAPVSAAAAWRKKKASGSPSSRSRRGRPRR